MLVKGLTLIWSGFFGIGYTADNKTQPLITQFASVSSYYLFMIVAKPKAE